MSVVCCLVTLPEVLMSHTYSSSSCTRESSVVLSCTSKPAAGPLPSLPPWRQAAHAEGSQHGLHVVKNNVVSITWCAAPTAYAHVP
jgi:hypothetical protein